MSIQEEFTYSSGRRNQESNRHLAQTIINQNDVDSIKYLVQLVRHCKKKHLRRSAVLTLAHIGEKAPELLLGQVNFLIENLKDDVNGVVFGSMIALSNIADSVQDECYTALPRILDAMDDGTVVTRDHGYRILIVLYQNKKYQEDAFFLILEQLMKVPFNQLGQYTERILKVMNISHKQRIIEVLEERRTDITNPYHINRLNKNLKKLYKQ